MLNEKELQDEFVRSVKMRAATRDTFTPSAASRIGVVALRLLKDHALMGRLNRFSDEMIPKFEAEPVEVSLSAALEIFMREYVRFMDSEIPQKTHPMSPKREIFSTEAQKVFDFIIKNFDEITKLQKNLYADDILGPENALTFLATKYDFSYDSSKLKESQELTLVLHHLLCVRCGNQEETRRWIETEKQKVLEN
jgi:hypothetical protein